MSQRMYSVVVSALKPMGDVLWCLRLPYCEAVFNLGVCVCVLGEADFAKC